MTFTVFICVSAFGGWFLPSVTAQEETEVVVNLATGRVVVYVAKDGIAVGAFEERGEAGSRAPMAVALGGHRMALLLGAVEWLQPGTGAPPVRMDTELLKRMQDVVSEKQVETQEAGDIESLGLAILEAMRPMTSRLHRKLDLGEEEPILEVVIVGYALNYGPEVWKLSYRIAQDPVRGNYWSTRILRPRYEQLYPPEKGQPRTLIEVRFPPDAGGAPLAERAQNEPEFAALRSGDAQMVRAGDSLRKGESNKAKLDDATPWLRALTNAAGPKDTSQIFAVISEQRGFEWILAPPESEGKAAEESRQPGAPTLRKKRP